MKNKTKDNEKLQKTGWKAELINWIQIIAFAAVIAFVLNTFIIANTEVSSGSMETTIMTDSRIVGSRLHYRFSKPQRGDIAIFDFGWRCPECRRVVEGEQQDSCPYCNARVIRRAETIHYVKRVIGLPGDRVDITGGAVYVNGSETPLDEPYIAAAMEVEEDRHFEVPENCFFMMGDNRNDSIDSRYWKNPYVSKNKILAKALFEYYPKIKTLD